MIATIRVILVSIISIGICIFGIVYCLLIPFKFRRNIIFGRLFGCMAPIFGIKIKIRNFFLGKELPKNCIYIANHQNNYDMVTVSYVVQSNTVTVGKKSLLWIPLFGQLYWLSGNIMINRLNSIERTFSPLRKIIKFIKKYNTSVWIFPEGTRNYGKGLLPFKIGAFYIATYFKIPIIPICVSNISNKIKLNRWSNGLVIIEIMPPVETYLYELNQTRRIAAYCHKIMQLKINSLDEEILSLENHFINK